MSVLSLILTGAVFSVVLTMICIRMGGLSADIPNVRSSHKSITPRGGGVGIVIASFLTYLVFRIHEADGLFSKFELGVIFPAFLIFILGALDDKFSLKSSIRFAVQILLAYFVIINDIYWKQIGLLGYSIDLPEFLATVFTILWIVWITNLFNFMDGLNGIALLQSLIVCTIIILFSWNSIPLSLWLAALIGAQLGFLPFNFPKAKIFMGDSGSLFLGFLVAVLPIYIHSTTGRVSTFMGFLIIAPFFLDAFITLVIRAYKRENVISAHKSHFYQKLNQATNGSHIIPTALYSCLAAVSGILFLNYSKFKIMSFIWVGVVFMLFLLIQKIYRRQKPTC